jgi:outer membrane protein
MARINYFLLLSGGLMLAGFPAHADTMEQALVKAYQGSPRLQSVQAQVRAVDEQVAQALSGYRPSVDASADISRLQQTRVGGGGDVRHPKSLGVTVTQPVFRGFRTSASVSAAKSQVLSARASLQNEEQTLLLETATSYMNLYRDEAVLGLSRNNEQVLRKQLEAAQDRFSVGEVTRTDVSQAEARLARASADRIQAEGNLAIARANYTRLVGDEPRNIARPRVELTSPKTLDEAIEMAQYNNPNVASAEYLVDVAKEQVTVAAGSLLPEVLLTGSAERDYDTSFVSQNKIDSFSVGARATVPLYRSGADYSRVRSAKQTVGQRQMDMDEAVRRAREGAIQAWQQLVTARAAIESRKAQVRSSELALDGVKQEASVGTRTTLDTLDAEQELLDAKVQLVRAERDMVVAVYETKAAVGQMTAQGLALPVQVYNPTVYYDDNAGKWIGLGD